MEFYTEQLYKKRKSALDWLLQIGSFVLAVALCAVVFVLCCALSVNFGAVLGTLLIVIAAYFCYKYQVFLYFDREYEYSYFNGDFDVDLIIAKSTRKRILSVKASDVQRFGTYRDGVKTSVNFDKIIDVTSGYDYEGTSLCFMTLHTREYGNVLLLFEPKNEILDDLKLRLRQISFEG